MKATEFNDQDFIDKWIEVSKRTATTTYNPESIGALLFNDMLVYFVTDGKGSLIEAHAEEIDLMSAEKILNHYRYILLWTRPRTTSNFVVGPNGQLT